MACILLNLAPIIQKIVKMGRQKAIYEKKDLVILHNAIQDTDETAEIKVIVTRSREKLRNESFVMLFQAVNKAISRDITPSAAKLLLHIMSEANYGNSVLKGQEEIAKELKYSKRNIIRAFAELVQMGILIRNKYMDDKRMSTYTINPFQSWKGSVTERKKHIAENPNQMALAFNNTGKHSNHLSQPPVNTKFLEE